MLYYGKFRGAETDHAMAMRYRKRRKSLIVARDVQKRTIGNASVLSILGLGFSLGFVAISCLELMRKSSSIEEGSASLVPLMLGVLAFFISAACLALFQGLHYANWIAGPTQRLCSIMKKVRAGDLTVRAHLRRGDYLGDLAAELNNLIDWLNVNPPSGSRTGSDVVHIDHYDEESDELEALSAGEQEKGW